MEPSQADFCHPYQPYSIQLDFMIKLYRCIEEKKVGIFESPTGTGKSLSLICGALTWLRDHERNQLRLEGHDSSDWLLQAELAAERRALLLEREELERKLARIREEEARGRQKKADSKGWKKPRITPGTTQGQPPDDIDFLVEEYDSGTEEATHRQDTNHGLSSSTQALLDKLRNPTQTDGAEEETDRLKIIFCSRTHSQLTQFVNELRRVKAPSSIPPELQHASGAAGPDETIKHLALGSRKNLCINPKVARLATATAINEQCLELQKPGIAKDKKCPHVPSKDDAERIRLFRDKAIAQIRDIEDIGNLGKALQICPYYASRAAIASTEILTLPYPLLLQRSAREALGVSIKNNVIVIDEAHNLMDAIADTFSISLHQTQLEQALHQVTAYATRFKQRLKGKNRVYVTQLIRILNSLTACLQNAVENSTAKEVTVTAAQLMSGKGVDQIKPHKLLQYLHESKLCHKVEGFNEAQKTEGDSNASKGALMQFQNFLFILMNPDDEGRLFVSQQENDIVVRYTLLDPREHFRDIVQDSRSVILAGGTMSPMSDYSEYLLSYLDKDRLQTFSFGHVIPATHLFAQAVTKGPSNIEFDFTYGKRGSDSMIIELGNLVVQVCKVVPDGVVMFFPSYDYLAQVVSVWKRCPGPQSLMGRLAESKVIFQESKGISVEELLQDYAHAVDAGRGGLLLAVIGGKLSEGINFSDKLGRAVIAVGLPFPNAHSAEWKAKMEHIEELRYQQCKEEGTLREADCKAAAKSASRDFYENACMRAINQSIGRVIRHKDDYAAILMVDRRFATERIRRKLPGWIQASLCRDVQAWREIESGVDTFFRGKQ